MSLSAVVAADIAIVGIVGTVDTASLALTVLVVQRRRATLSATFCAPTV
jgi:hypothetical protein